MLTVVPVTAQVSTCIDHVKTEVDQGTLTRQSDFLSYCILLLLFRPELLTQALLMRDCTAL